MSREARAVAHVGQVEQATALAWLWLPPQAGKTTDPRPSAPPRPLNLTREELDVALLLAAGRSRDEISFELALPRDAVDERLRRVLAELSLTTAAPAEITAAFLTQLAKRTAAAPDSLCRQAGKPERPREAAGAEAKWARSP
jgi:DNA-binding NarL/FixJ family response regulator